MGHAQWLSTVQFKDLHSGLFTEVGGAKADVSATYTIEGAPDQTFSWTPNKDKLTLTTHALKAWAPPCGTGSRPVRLRIVLKANVRGGQQGIYSLNGLDVQMSDHAVWRRCGAP